jgi:hypothetical protein
MFGALVCLMASGPAGGESDAPPALPCARDDRTRVIFGSLCEFNLRYLGRLDALFVGGYAMRTLVAGYEVFDDRRYLDAAIDYADHILTLQDERGYWTTGYSRHIYLADTGSALGLLIDLYPHVDTDRQARYLEATERYVSAIEADSLVLPSGAIGTGWRALPDQVELVPYRDPYTISSALTGGEIFTWMYHRTGEDRYRTVAANAMAWILSTMREDGVIPYVLAGEGSDLAHAGAPAVDHVLWEKWRYDTSAYVGEGLVAFDLFSDDDTRRDSIRDGFRPHIEFLIRSQNADGSWAVPGSDDQKRSPGVVNLLVWYHQNVEADPRVARAVCRFADFLADAEAVREFGLMNAGAAPTHENSIVTALTGRALADIVRPGVTTRW